MTLGSERRTVQEPLIRYAQEVGWAYLPPEEALRLHGGKSGLVLREVLIQQLLRLNPGVVQGLEVLKERFQRLMDRAEAEFLGFWKGQNADKAVDAVLEHFRNQERREEFYRFFRELQDLYEILSPEPFLRPYLEAYEQLADMYRILKENFEPGVPVDREFLRKTARIVQRHTRTPEVAEPDAVYALDGKALQKLTEAQVPEVRRVFNLIKAFFQLVASRRHQDPYLIPIGERADAIARRFYERQISSTEALEELELLVQEVQKAERAREHSHLSPEGFAVFWFLKLEGVGNAEAIAQQVEQALKTYPHWTWNEAQERELRRRLYRVLPERDLEEMTALVERLLQMLRRAHG